MEIILLEFGFFFVNFIFVMVWNDNFCKDICRILILEVNFGMIK